MALYSGFHSLIETAAAADSHLSLGFTDRLATLRETYKDKERVRDVVAEIALSINHQLNSRRKGCPPASDRSHRLVYED